MGCSGAEVPTRAWRRLRHRHWAGTARIAASGPQARPGCSRRKAVTPSPSQGEGWGEGDWWTFSASLQRPRCAHAAYTTAVCSRSPAGPLGSGPRSRGKARSCHRQWLQRRVFVPSSRRPGIVPTPRDPTTALRLRQWCACKPNPVPERATRTASRRAGRWWSPWSGDGRQGAPPATCRTRRWWAWSTGSTVENRHPSPSPQPSPWQGEGVTALRR